MLSTSVSVFKLFVFSAFIFFSGQIFRIGTVRYAEGLWRMRRHGPVIAHCTDSEDFPFSVLPSGD